MYCIMTSKLKTLGSCSSHHLQGAGAYCGKPHYRLQILLLCTLLKAENSIVSQNFCFCFRSLTACKDVHSLFKNQVCSSNLFTAFC